MAFLPFYIPSQKRLRIVIVGGGYAGVAALTVLSQYASHVDITLIDPKTQHLKITHLHETFRYPLSDLLVPFADLESRFDCRHICAAPTIDEESLAQWHKDQFIVINNEKIAFDYLLIATGCSDLVPQKIANVMTLNDFMNEAGSDILNKVVAGNRSEELGLTVVGGGATGIQFLFEIEAFLKRRKINKKLTLVDGGDHVLKQFPIAFSSYVETRMKELDIAFYPHTYFLEQKTDEVLLQDKKTKQSFSLPSQLSVYFTGKSKQSVFDANANGQIIINGEPSQRLFTAGDCSNYSAFGSNTLTAQSAVRKGKLVARNMLRHSSVINILEPYLHRDLGYVVSLGSSDAVGWLALEGNVVHGLPAQIIKEVVEAQYDLLLTGVDTYLV